MYTYNVQYADFKWDQVREMGPLDLAGALEAFRHFPFEEEFERGGSLPFPTAPTIAFRSDADKAALAVWLIGLQPRVYEVHLEDHGAKVTAKISDEQFILEAIRSFFEGNRTDLFQRLALQARADAKFQSRQRLVQAILIGVWIGGGVGSILALVAFFVVGSPAGVYVAISIMAICITVSIGIALRKLPRMTPPHQSPAIVDRDGVVRSMDGGPGAAPPLVGEVGTPPEPEEVRAWYLKVCEGFCCPKCSARYVGTDATQCLACKIPTEPGKWYRRTNLERLVVLGAVALAFPILMAVTGHASVNPDMPSLVAWPLMVLITAGISFFLLSIPYAVLGRKNAFVQDLPWESPKRSLFLGWRRFLAELMYVSMIFLVCGCMCTNVVGLYTIVQKMAGG